MITHAAQLFSFKKNLAFVDLMAQLLEEIRRKWNRKANVIFCY